MLMKAATMSATTVMTPTCAVWGAALNVAEYLALLLGMNKPVARFDGMV